MSLQSGPSSYTVVTVCDMYQHALDFEGNYERIRGSILAAKSQGSRLRVGPELETCGYSCEDHLLEHETLLHNYSVIAKILGDKELHDIVIDVGCFVQHQGVRYNAKAIILNGKILLIRPKTSIASDKCYFEARWFTPWSHKELQQWSVPTDIAKVCGQVLIPIGVAVIDFIDTCIGLQICEEVYLPDSWHQAQVHNGAEIIANGSGNMFEVGKLATLLDLIRDASEKGKCGYMYSSLSGCDGGRAYFDGGSLIYSCGKLRDIIPRFKLNSNGFTNMTTYIDLNEIRAKRGIVHSWTHLASRAHVLPRIRVEWFLCVNRRDFIGLHPQMKLTVADAIDKFCDPLEELVGATTCWLWDYLVTSQASGFMVPLNGKPNSTAVVVLIYMLCSKLFDAVVKDHDEGILKQIREVLKNDKYNPKSVNELCKNLTLSALFTCSDVSESTGKLVSDLSEEIGTVHFEIPMADSCQNYIKQTKTALGVDANSFFSSKTLLTLKHRQQLVQCYLLAQLYAENKADRATQNLSNSPLLLLGTANADKSAMGFLTKYGCGSGDIGIISDMSKENVLDILAYAETKFSLKTVKSVLDNHALTVRKEGAAEKTNLEGSSAPAQSKDFGNTQETSKLDSSMPESKQPSNDATADDSSYRQDAYIDHREIDVMRTLRKNDLLGPLTMFRTLADMWYFGSKEKTMTLESIAAKVKSFFLSYSNNRHKSVTLPPYVHLSVSSHNDSRADFRPILYDKMWKFQFRCIDDEVKGLSSIN